MQRVSERGGVVVTNRGAAADAQRQHRVTSRHFHGEGTFHSRARARARTSGGAAIGENATLMEDDRIRHDARM